MSLNSFYFLIYFAILFVVLVILQFVKKIRGGVHGNCGSAIQIALLLVFSYFFIAKSNWKFCVCVFCVTMLSYGVGLWIDAIRENEENSTGKQNRFCKLIAYGGGIILIGILGYFKYSNFFIESFNRVFGGSISTLKIILPVGISFYIFSALSYIIDVYGRKYDAERNLIFFALYISFFPKITAGPIVRADEFLPQVRKYKGLSQQAFLDGIQIFVFGLFKKIVLADHLGVFVDDVFFAPSAFNTGTVILGALSYSLQIYLDFSGYSDMAIGLAKMLGFDLKSNFNLPYFATDAADFWKRWHISLSSWLRDYVYIPLGGSRRGKARTYINLLLTMIISGLWHGVGWTFIIWGFLHGVFSCVDKLLNSNRPECQDQAHFARNAIGRILTFLMVTLLWVVFRAASVSNAWNVLHAMFTIHSGISQPYTWSFFAALLVMVATVAAWKKNGGNGFYPIMDLSRFWNLVAFFCFCGLTIIMGYFGNTAFIYGKF